MAITLDGTKGTTTPGLYSNSTFTGTYTDGVVVDYTTGQGRISVGPADGLGIYNGGVAGTQIASFGTDGSINVPNTFGFKNRFINGDMRINQRGASGLSSGTGVLTYSLDRFFTYATGAAVTMSQYTGVNFGSTVTSVLQVTGASSNTSFNVGQRIEAANIRDLAGQSVAFSCWVYQTTGSTQTFTVNAYTPTATDNWSSQNTYANVVSASVASGVWTYVSGTFTLNSTAQYGGGLSFGNFALGSGQQFAVGNVQLEKGTVATSFDTRSIGTELALCQRYYYRMGQDAVGPACVYSANNYYTSITFPVTMRAAPTFSASASNILVCYSSGGGYTSSAINGGVLSTYGADVQVTATGTAGNGAFMRFTNSGFLQFTAEL